MFVAFYMGRPAMRQPKDLATNFDVAGAGIAQRDFADCCAMTGDGPTCESRLQPCECHLLEPFLNL
jgi:hypothetical protein